MQVLIAALVLIIICLIVKLGPDLIRRLRAFKKWPTLTGRPDDLNGIAENIRRTSYQWRREERPIGPLYTGTLDRGFGNRSEVICDPAAKKLSEAITRRFLFAGISLSDNSYSELSGFAFDVQPLIDAIESKLRSL